MTIDPDTNCENMVQNPLSLLEYFAQRDKEKEQEGSCSNLPAIRKDIDIERVVCDTRVSPLDFNIISTGGKLSIERNEVVRYLKAKKVVYIGTIPYIFDGCTYKQKDATDVARLIYDAVDAYGYPNLFVTKTMISDILSKLQAVSTPFDIPIPEGWDEEGLYEPSEIIPFDNGLYNFAHDEFLRFSSNVFIDYQLSGTYNPKITEHPVEKYYKKILPDAETRRFFFEVVGYSLFSNEMFPPAIFVIYGPGHTGKSALQKAVMALAGWDNVSSLDLYQLSGEFTTIRLVGKLINICGETGSKQSRFDANIDGELLKRLSDGQPITVQHKFGKPFEICNTAKLWFVTNTIPDFGDTSSGIYRRVFIIPCRHEQDDSDRLYDKLTEPTAVSWLANKALQGYRDFLNNGRQFHVSSECMIEARAYKKQDALMDFLDEKFGTTSRYTLPSKINGWMVADLYNDYREYCRSSGGREMSSKKFSEKIRNEFSLTTVTVHTYKSDGSPTTARQFSMDPKRI